MAAQFVPTVVAFALLGQGLLAIGVGASTERDGRSGISANSFGDSFREMSQFRALAHSGRGEIGVLLPDPAVARLAAPDLSQALVDGGLQHRDVDVQDADGSDAAEFSAAEHDIAHGARVLILDPIDSGVGTQIEVLAQTRGVKTIDYDDLSLGGSRSYYVGYDSVVAGRQLVQGLAKCLSSWHVPHPRLLVMPGPSSDGTATLLTQGYTEALRPLVRSHRWVEVAQPAGTWNPATAATEFRAAYDNHREVNAALVTNDQTDGAIIKYLQSTHMRPHTFPTTGYGATIEGLQEVLSGYQCGTVYLPTAREAQAAVALALYIRAGMRPPDGLVNGTVFDTIARVDVPSVLVSPQWVTSSNLASTVLKQGDVTSSQLCAGSYADSCRTAGIKP